MAGCYLSVDNDFIDLITPVVPRNNLTSIPCRGTLKLILKNMENGDKIGSLSISLDSLKKGTFWLPLFEDIYEDFIKEVPASANFPRIEVSVREDRTSSLIFDNIEKMYLKLKEEYDAALVRAQTRDRGNLLKIEDLLQKQIEAQATIAKLNHVISAKDNEIEHLNERINKISIDNWKLTPTDKHEASVEEISIYKTQISKLKQELDESNKIMLNLSSLNLCSCNSHEEEIQRLNTQVFTLKQTILELQRNQKKSSEKVEGELIKQIKELNEKLETSELAKENLILEKTEMKQELAAQEKLIHGMKGMIEGCKTERLLIVPKTPLILKRKDSIDKSLEEYHTSQNIKSKFVRLAKGLYEYGNKKVNVSIKNGTIVCRVGGGYVQLDEFLNSRMSSTNSSPKKVQMRGSSNSPVRGRNHYQLEENPEITLDSIFDIESLLNYSCDSEESRTRSS